MPSDHDQASRPPAPGSADPLSDALATLRLQGAMFFLWDVSWPFATPVPDGRHFAPILLPGAQQAVSYHVVTEGHCFAGLVGESHPTVRLDAGDILLVPQGASYVMASSEPACREAAIELDSALAFYRSVAAGELPFVVREGGGGPELTRVVCGFLGCDLWPFNPVLGSLPRLVRLRRAPDGPLQPLIELAVAESRAPRPGGRSVLLRLSELMFVEVVRRCLSELPDASAGWLAGLRDPVVGRALAHLHHRPAEAWSVERLARSAGTSRSRLAEAFTTRLGLPPMRYLARWRMQVAAGLLVTSSDKVSTIAGEVGYRSEAAFSRAFKRATGVSPAEWRARSAHQGSLDDGDAS